MKSLSMLSLICAVAALAFCLTSSKAEAANFAGKWAINGYLGDPPFADIKPICTLKQEGAELHGTCKGPNAFGTATGAVNGRKILLTWKHAATTDEGYDGIATFKGTLDEEGIIRGTWTDSQFPDAGGPWTGQRV